MYPNLKAEMARKNINVKKLAELTGTSISAFYDKLRGVRSFTFEECLKIKEVLDVDMALECLFAKGVA